MNQALVYYIAIINIVSGALFVFDKLAAKYGFRRIKETALHCFELLGGVFVNLMLMYLIRHKNKKTRYNQLTWTILILWILGLLISYYN